MNSTDDPPPCHTISGMDLIPYPVNDYLLLIGRLAYAVTYMEGSVLFDLPRHRKRLPSALTAETLAGETTGTIARIIADNLSEVSDPALSTWLTAAAQHLDAAAKVRNPILQARPATVDGQRLHRWRPGQALSIDTQALRRDIADLENRCTALMDLRVP